MGDEKIIQLRSHLTKPPFGKECWSGQILHLISVLVTLSVSTQDSATELLSDACGRYEDLLNAYGDDLKKITDEELMRDVGLHASELRDVHDHACTERKHPFLGMTTTWSEGQPLWLWRAHHNGSLVLNVRS